MMAPAALRRRILFQSLAGEHPRTLAWTTLLFLLVSAIGFALGAALGPDPLRNAFRFGGTVLVCLAAFLWATFCASVTRQNTPANARLVPGLNQVLRACTARAWVLAMAMALPLAWGHPHGILVLALIGIALTALGLCVAGRDAGLWVLISTGALYAFASANDALMAILAQPVWSLAGVLGCLVYAACALPAALPAGGERHWINRDKQLQLKAAFDVEAWTRAGRSNGGRHRLFSKVLERDCRGGHIADLLLHGLGPRNHRFVLVGMLAATPLLIMLVKPAMLLLGWPVSDLVKEVGKSLLTGALGGLVFCWTRFAYSIRSSSGEQALLRLAPAAPAASELNRVLGARIAAICLVEWAACMLVLMFTLWLWDGSVAQARGAAVPSALLLGVCGYSLQDYARKPRRPAPRHFLGFVLLFSVMMASFATNQNPAHWSVVFVLALAISLSHIAMRWRRMQRGRVAFPAGRID